MKLRNSSIQFKFAPALLIILTLGSFAICQSVQGVVPPPDGGYPNFNTAEGTNALKNLTTGVGNAAVGWYSLFSNTDGSFNTGIGAGTLALNTGGNNTAVGGAALLSNTSGSDNTAVGVTALVSNSTGYLNTATGVNALSGNTAGVGNNAFGWGALLSNTTGTNNNAIGVRALQNNTEGSANVALGEQALLNNTTGAANTAVGYQALFGNNGNTNTAIGFAALQNNTTGNDNIAVGYNALFGNTASSFNTAVGVDALSAGNNGENTAIGYRALLHNNGFSNTAIGYGALLSNTSGTNNTAVGWGAGASVTTGSHNVYLGALVTGDASEDYTTRIANIFGRPGGTQAVYVDSDGRLGMNTSSRRFKEEIRSMDKASEVIYSLKPVSFRYKTEIEPTRPLSFGLIAEDVEQINADLVLRGKDGKVSTVRYEAVNAMLLNEFLKEHQKVEQLEANVATLAATVREQAAEIQKVSALVGATEASAQVASRNNLKSVKNPRLKAWPRLDCARNDRNYVAVRVP